MQVQNGTADVVTYFVLRDSTNHAPKTDVTITDIDLYYCEQGAAMAAKVDATALAAADSAHADNKAFHVGQGLYRVDWPDAAFDGGVGKVVNLAVVCTGVDTTFLEVELTGVAQTGDSFARLGAPAGASVSADVAAVKAETALIVEDTGTDIPAAFAALADDATIAGAVRTELTTELGVINNLNDITVADIIAGITEGTLDLQEILRIILAAVAGETTGSGTPTVTFTDPTGTVTRISATISSGNRTAVTLDGS